MSDTMIFHGSNSASTGRKNLFTGLNVFSVLALNPSKDKIEELTGVPYRLNVDYSIQNINNKRVRPIEIWLKSIDNYIKAENLRFLIGTDDDVNQNGTTRYVNVVGEFCQSKTDPKENPRMDWFTKHSYRVAKLGEYELFSFMQALMRYNSRADDAAFMEDAEKAGITVEKLFDNDLVGLQNFIEWAASNDNKVVLLAAVRKSQKNQEDGTTRVYENQVLVGNPEYFFRTSTNEVNNRSYQAITVALEKGRRVTNSLFTIYFQEYKEDDCLNKAPQETAAEETDIVQSFQNWKPM